jgi:hypothetical protein
MAKPAPEKMVRATALRGVRVEGRRVAPGENFEVGENALAMMVSAGQAAAADSDAAKAAAPVTKAAKSA